MRLSYMGYKGSKPRPYKPDDHDKGYERIYGKDKPGIVKLDDQGHITDVIEGIFIKDVYKSDQPFPKYQWNGERIKSIVKLYNGKYAVCFDRVEKQYLDQWEICQEVKNG